MLATRFLAAALLASAATAGTVRLSDLVPDYMEGDLETAITPTPQEAELKTTAFPAGKVAILWPAGYLPPPPVLEAVAAILGPTTGDLKGADTLVLVGNSRRNPLAASAIASHGLAAREKALADKGEDAYLLHAASDARGGQNLVLLAGNAPPGDLWALATLRQMVFEKDGTRAIREGTVADFPRFPLRGNKRPRAWEWRYKANYGWSFAARKEKLRRPLDNFRWDLARRHGAWIRHGDPLMATDAEMDALIAGFDETRKDGKTRHVQGALDVYKAGCREFVLKFDDTGSKMTDATKAAFGTDFLKALHHYLLGMHKRIKAIDAANRVFFMPRPYSANSFELGEYAKGLLSHGPLPADIGLSVCGPEVISFAIPTGCLREFRETFGLKARAQIYDNYGRGGQFFAIHGRDPDLWKEVDCIFPERGTPVTRITVYDYLWNPEAYAPGRSLRLAVRELAGRRPDLYKPLLDTILAFNANYRLNDYPARDAAVAHLRKTNAALKAKFDALKPLLAASPLAEEAGLAFELWGPEAPRTSFEWGEFARLRRRIDFEPYMARFGFQETAAAPAPQAPTVDGRLDEPAWKKAPAFDSFSQAAWGRKEPPADLDALRLAGDQATSIRLLHTPTHLFVGIQFAYATKPALPSWAAKRWQGLAHGSRPNYAWRVPCFEILLDVDAKRREYFQVISNIAGLWLSKHHEAYRPGKVGQGWTPRWTFAYSLGEKQGVLEASVPFADLGTAPPKPGAVWGFQCFRSKMGTFGLFSGTYDLVGGHHSPHQFGRIVFR